MGPGDVLGRYELGDELGEGGMATVFRARDRELRRDVAVKVLFPHLARRQDIVKRFHREARAAAGLEHPNILRIYDVGGGEGDDPPYIVMELIRGRTLLEEMEQRGPMLAEIVACIGALLADGLAAAHTALIVHRDIKPSNVLVAHGGRLLLADFGVARLETENSLVTRTGALLGTPAYMSPEQASGDVATAKSDIYSLGATLYQLATGHLPYTGSTAKVMSQIAAGQLVSPVRRRASVGPDLSRMIEQMMASEPEMRPANAATISTELRAFAAKGGFTEPKDELAKYFEDPDKFIAEKTPSIVSALLVTAERALAEEKLPRAMALADRASALAPNDPAVEALIEKVTEGGRATQRKKIFLIAGLGVLVVGGGATALVMSNGSQATSLDAAMVMTPDVLEPDAAPDAIDAAIDAPPVDAPVIDAPRTRIDAAAVRPLDAAIAMQTPDAFVAIDAPVDAPVVVEKGKIAISNDTWCDLTIDGVDRGQIQPPSRTFDVDVGEHVVTCKQAGLNEWTEKVRVTAGKTTVVTKSMLQLVEIRFDLDVTINNKSYAKGTKAPLKPGRVNVRYSDKSEWITIPRFACRLHVDGGRLVCDP